MTEVGAPAIDLLARVLYLARYMLAQRPETADLLLNGIKESDLPSDYETGRFVVRMRTDGEVGFIVGDHGTFTTTTTLPPWADEREVIDLGDRTAYGTQLWDLLQAHASELQAASPAIYEQAEIAAIVDVLSIHFTNPALAPYVHGGAGVPPVTVDELRHLLSSPDATRKWAHDSYSVAREAYHSLRVPIEPARKALSTLGLFELWPDPRVFLGATILRTARPNLGPDDVQALATQPDEVVRAAAEFPIDGFSIMFEPGFYVTAAELNGAPGLKAAFRVGTIIEAAGTSTLDTARDVSSLQLFYGLLSDALLSFMAADSMFGFVESMFSPAADSLSTFPDLKARRLVCEERRVTILASLFQALGVTDRGVTPTSFPRLGAYINTLAAGPLETAELLVRDMTLRLVLPGFMRELVRGTVYRLNGDPARARDILMPVLERLEADRPRNSQIPAEPNFILPLREELASTFEALGDAGMAASMR